MVTLSRAALKRNHGGDLSDNIFVFHCLGLCCDFWTFTLAFHYSKPGHRGQLRQQHTHLAIISGKNAAFGLQSYNVINRNCGTFLTFRKDFSSVSLNGNKNSLNVLFQFFTRSSTTFMSFSLLLLLWTDMYTGACWWHNTHCCQWLHTIPLKETSDTTILKPSLCKVWLFLCAHWKSICGFTNSLQPIPVQYSACRNVMWKVEASSIPTLRTVFTVEKTSCVQQQVM